MPYLRMHPAVFDGFASRVLTISDRYFMCAKLVLDRQ
jgi:hypothetical protein